MEHAQQHATLSHGAYEKVEKAAALAGQHGYEIIEEDSDKSKQRNHTVYKHKETGEHVLAYRGTAKRNLIGDMVSNIQLSIGITPSSLKDAEKIAKQAKEKYGDNLVLSGHSLGGAKAIYAGKSLGIKSITHNPYVAVNMKKGLKDYFRQTGSTAHVNVHDVIGSSAVEHLPKSHVVAYTHEPKHPHSIKGFHGNEGVRLSAKKVSTTETKLAKAGAIASTVAALSRETIKAVKGRSQPR
jgi:hypothetical protein